MQQNLENGSLKFTFVVQKRKEGDKKYLSMITAFTNINKKLPVK